MIAVFTDFGPGGPYTGQVMAVLASAAPGVPVIDLMDNAPGQNPKASAYILAALAGEFPAGVVFLAVVDPGVGGPRPAAAIHAAERWFVGPGNGLFEIVLRRAEAVGAAVECHEITWRPEKLSSSFHGRDLFAPVAARLATGADLPGELRPADWARAADWPDDLSEVVYVDGYGNAMTGLRSSRVDPSFELIVKDNYVQHAETFSNTSPGGVFWYVNSNDLVEIAVNQGNAAEQLGLAVGTPVSFKE